MFERILLYTIIKSMPDLSQEAECPEGFNGFTQSCQANIGIVPQILSFSVLSNAVFISHPTVELLTASANRQ